MILKLFAKSINVPALLVLARLYPSLATENALQTNKIGCDQGQSHQCMTIEVLVFSAEIVGKRISVKLDGSQLLKVNLDKKQKTTIEHKVDTFQSVSKKLTGREVTFKFPKPFL